MKTFFEFLLGILMIIAYAILTVVLVAVGVVVFAVSLVILVVISPFWIIDWLVKNIIKLFRR